MDHPVRVAFCPILFAANGGRFSERGLPIIRDRDEDGESVRGKCDLAFDCGTCPHLSRWVRQYIDAGWGVGWECQHCLKVTRKEDEERYDRRLPGFYQAGRDPASDPFPDLPDFDNSDPDNVPLKGCTRCGWQSSFLQLVLRGPKGDP